MKSTELQRQRKGLITLLLLPLTTVTLPGLSPSVSRCLRRSWSSSGTHFPDAPCFILFYGRGLAGPPLSVAHRAWGCWTSDRGLRLHCEEFLRRVSTSVASISSRGQFIIPAEYLMTSRAFASMPWILFLTFSWFFSTCLVVFGRGRPLYMFIAVPVGLWLFRCLQLSVCLLFCSGSAGQTKRHPNQSYYSFYFLIRFYFIFISF